MKKRTVVIVLITVSTLILLNFLLLIFFFHTQKISYQLSDWANFAEYITGTTNVLISIMTLFITLFIAYEISNLDEKRNNSNIAHDKQKFERDLRERAYLEITDSFNNFWIAITHEDPKIAKNMLYIIRQRFVSFIQHKNHLFPELNAEEFKKLDTFLIELMELVEKNIATDNPKNVELVGKFQNELSLFHIKVQNYIINEK